MALISQPGSDYQIVSISLDAGYTRDLILMLTDVHAVLDHLYLDGTQPEITSPAEDYLRESASPYSLPALIDALGEVTGQLSRAERQALDRIPPGPPACEPASSNPPASFEVPRGFRTVHPLGWMSGKVKELPRPKKSFSPEFKDEAVKMVIETSRPIARVAKELGINEGTLGNWVGIYRREHAGEEPALTVNERARLRELERETRELKMENDFLKKAAAYFAKDHR